MSHEDDEPRKDKSPSPGDLFRRLLFVDAAAVISFFIGYGVMWEKVEGLIRQVNDLQVQARLITPGAAERLARVEARVELLLDNQTAMSAKIDRLVERESGR
jgi:hypothetical protein